MCLPIQLLLAFRETWERTIPLQFNRGGESCGSSNTSPASVCILEEIWGYKMKELCFTAYLSQSPTGGLPELLDIYTILMFWKHSPTDHLCITQTWQQFISFISRWHFCRVAWATQHSHGWGECGSAGATVWANFGKFNLLTVGTSSLLKRGCRQKRVLSRDACWSHCRLFFSIQRSS